MTINSTVLDYIVSISSKIIPPPQSESIDKLDKMFGVVQEIKGLPWYLCKEGTNERIYRVTRSKNNPLLNKDIEQLKSIFNEENKIIKIYKLEEII